MPKVLIFSKVIKLARQKYINPVPGEEGTGSTDGGLEGVLKRAAGNGRGTLVFSPSFLHVFCAVCRNSYLHSSSMQKCLYGFKGTEGSVLANLSKYTVSLQILCCVIFLSNKKILYL